ncbi:CTLH/CRA C-terminal to lish motif domain-containing protein [Hyaloraphidium curvatum]|nr:CTLH/CRA C-terminal to lish motif domain-containing protein [Hyaloraphidium curvatum]
MVRFARMLLSIELATLTVAWSPDRTWTQKPNPPAQTKKVTIPRDEWEKRLAEVKINKQDLNKLVMNYLVIEGYKDAAEKFAQETGLEPSVELESIEDRMNIRNAVQNGDIDQAIAHVNDLDPEILDVNPKLYFHLKQQKLIELIRTGDVVAALEFAQEELAPRGEENPEFLSELERTMALLAFPLEAVSASPVADLFDQSQRQRIASELNSAVLISQSQDDSPKLPSLIRMLLWSQQQLEERANFPKIKDVVTSHLEDPPTTAL